MVEKSRVCFVLTCIPSSDAWTICVGVYFVYYSGACDACEVDSASSGSSYLEKLSGTVWRKSERTIIPLFRIFVARQLLDNVFWLSLVYVSSYLPMITWLMSNYFSTIPKELEEAAVIDGCGRLAVFMRIFLPISYPIILSAALIIFLNTWNQFQIPLILASSVETKPVAIVVSEFMTKDSIQYGLTAAAGIITVIPPAITALIFRKFLISGMMRGSVKG